MRAYLGPVAVLAGLWATALVIPASPWAADEINDLFVYRTYAGFLGDGLWPYHDFPFEYPPLALVPMWLGGVAGLGEGPYAIAFGALTLTCAIAVLLLAATLARAAGRARPAPGAAAGDAAEPTAASDDGAPLVVAWLLALLPLACGASLRTHFDLLPVALLLGALVLLVRDRPLPAFALLGAGAATKLFPALAVPLAAAWLAGRGRGREAALGAGVFAAVCLAVSLPFLGGGYLDALRFHLERPVQIESTPASVLWALGGTEVTGDPVAPDRFKSNGLEGAAAAPVGGAFTALLLATLAWLTARAARRPAPRDLVYLVFAALLAFVAFGKVLSPQYVIWVAPFAALAWAWGERAVPALCLGALVLTLVEFPGRYWELVAGEGWVVVLVGVRNGLLVAALVTLLVREAAPARSRRPAAAASPG